MFQIKFTIIDEVHSKQIQSLLNIVDLAGSERRNSLFNEDNLSISQTLDTISNKNKNLQKSFFETRKNSTIEYSSRQEELKRNNSKINPSQIEADLHD